MGDKSLIIHLEQAVLQLIPSTLTYQKFPNYRINLQTRITEGYVKYILDIYLLSFFLESLAKNACECSNRQGLAITNCNYNRKSKELYNHRHL